VSSEQVALGARSPPEEQDAMSGSAELHAGRGLKALTIAGSDSSAGAGIQADLATFRRLGAKPSCCVTAVTAQDERGVQAVFPLPIQIIEAQIDAAFHGQPVDCCKIGMVWSADIVEAVARGLTRHRPPVIVLDPVLAASRGGALAQEGLECILAARLFPLCHVIIPNISEAETILGCSILDLSQAQASAAELAQRAGCDVVLKGGHLPSNPGTDVICHRGEITLLPPDPSFPGHFHGTGCIFSSALAVFLVRNPDLVAASSAAKSLLSKWKQQE